VAVKQGDLRVVGEQPLIDTVLLARAIKNRKPVACHYLARHAVAQLAWYACRSQSPSGCQPAEQKNAAICKSAQACASVSGGRWEYWLFARADLFEDRE